MQSYTTINSTRNEYFDFATVAELEQQLLALPSSGMKRQAEDDLMILDDLLVDFGQQQSFSGYEAFEALFGASEPLAYSGQFDPKEELRIPYALSPDTEIPRSTSTVSSTSSSAYSAVTVPAAKSMPLDPAARRRERNRLAAERCRQRKTGLIETLQKECDELRQQKDQLLRENERLLRALGLKF